MATEFNQSSLLSAHYVLTSRARTLSVTTDERKLDISMEYGGEPFFEVELYAYNNVIEIYEPRPVIEDLCRRYGFVSVPVTLRFGTAVKPVTFLYCENEMMDSFSAEKSLLLSSSARRVHRGSKVTFAAVPTDGPVPFVVKVVGVDANGDIASYSYNDTRDFPELLYEEFAVDPIISRAVTAADSTLTDVHYFSISHEGRQLLCYVAPAASFLTFVFRNNFNVPERLDVEGSMTVKSEFSCETAYFYGDIEQYNRQTDRTYEFSTGPLSCEEIEPMQQLILSRHIQLCLGTKYYDVRIINHTVEHSTEDESLSVFKFTWRFKGRRPIDFSSPFLGIGPQTGGVFSDEYSEEYG